MTPIFRPALALALLVGSAAPALAGWQGAQWGMSPEETIAALDGAEAHSPDASEVFEFNGADYQPLVKLAHSMEGIEGEASLLFDADESLQFVVFIPAQIADCDALTAALVETHGAGEKSGFGSTAIYNWTDEDTVIRLTNSADIGICNLSYGAI